MNSAQLLFWSASMKSVMEYGNDVSSALFVHIPVHGYVTAIGAALKTGCDVYDIRNFTDVSGRIGFQDSYSPSNWNQDYEGSFGVMHEACCCPPYDDGVLDYVKDGCDFIIAGHDHKNNFCVKYDGVQLCYGMKTGTESYCDSEMIGCTVLKINSAGNVSVEHKLY